MSLNRFKRFAVEAAMVALLLAADVSAQSTLLLDDNIYQALIDETSGATALSYFDDLLEFSGWSPSLGADRTADYLAAKARSFGLQDVEILRFPSDGEQFFWAFRTEPWWEAQQATLKLVDGEDPGPEILASFDAYRGHLARFSTNAEVEAELVYVGPGMRAENYEARDVEGKSSWQAGTSPACTGWPFGSLAPSAWLRIERGITRSTLISSAHCK